MILSALLHHGVVLCSQYGCIEIVIHNLYGNDLPHSFIPT